MERISADKHEVDNLAKKYEDKYKQVGDVSSKLTTEEATFRDIQVQENMAFSLIHRIYSDTFFFRILHHYITIFYCMYRRKKLNYIKGLPSWNRM